MKTPATTAGDIDGVPINQKWFEGVMQRALKTDATLKSARGRRVDEGKGYCSLIASIQMEWKPNGKPVDSLLTRVVTKMPMIAKVNAAFENMQTAHGGDKDKVVTFDQMTENMSKVDGEQFDMSMWVHNNECLVYDLLTKKRTAPPPVAAATCYYYEKKQAADPNSGVIVLDDLSDRGKVPEFADNLTLNQVRSVFIALAQLHAWSFKHSDWYDDAKQEMRAFSKKEMEPFPMMMRAGIDALKRMPISKDIVKLTDEEADKLYDIDALWDMFDLAPEKQKHQPVLVHGDLWSHNLFFGYDKTTKKFTDELVAIIDWQTSRPGSCFEDMVRFMASSVDHKFRREHEYSLIDDYYAELQSLLKGTGISIPYSVADVKRWYKQALKMGVAVMTMHAPLVLATPEASGGYTDVQKLNLVWRVQAGIEDCRGSM